MKLSNVSSMYGAPMGRRTVVDTVDLFAGKLHLAQVRLNGDYDNGGAYWGYMPGTAIYRAWDDAGTVEVFVRAASRAQAKAKVELAVNGGCSCKFYR